MMRRKRNDGGERVKMQRPRSFEEFCLQFTTTKIPYVKIGKRCFHDPLGKKEEYEKKGWDLFSAGMYLGEERNEFFPTTALVDLIASDAQHTVTVNDKAAWLFLCGRDALMDGILEPAQGERIVIVLDYHGRALGYGRTMCAYDKKMRNKLYVKNILNRGEYLHRER